MGRVRIIATITTGAATVVIGRKQLVKKITHLSDPIYTPAMIA
jgi:hypothetical protein